MLWKKESPNPDALYVDILSPDTNNWRDGLNVLVANMDKKPHPEKSDAIALQKRNEGNEKFRARKWLDAIELYGDSLRFAQPDSEHISLAYANRGACFMSLKLYENCLKDIELAKEAGYPEHLMPKLEQRKENCLKKMQEDPQSERELTIEQPNDEFPCLANSAEVRKGENGEYSVIAKRDIDVGEMVVIEDLSNGYLMTSSGTRCNICLKEYGVLVPCKKCAAAMFCPKCSNDPLHDYECGLNFCDEGFINSATLFNTRSILRIIKAFPNIDDLMAFVEQCRKNPNELPANLLDDRAKYHALLTVAYKSKPIEKSTQMVVFPVYKTLLDIPQINEMFQSEKHRRFLMHLIGHRTDSSNLNYSNIRYDIITERYFKHSCYPNVISTIRDGKSIHFTIKPIKRGQQLTKTFVSLGIRSTEERKEELWESQNVDCNCTRCSGQVPSPEQRLLMITDPTYMKIQKNFYLLKNNFEEVNPSSLMDDCSTCLRRYGHLDWFEDIVIVIVLFHYLFSSRLTEDFDRSLTRARLSKLM